MMKDPKITFVEGNTTRIRIGFEDEHGEKRGIIVTPERVVELVEEADLKKANRPHGWPVADGIRVEEIICPICQKLVSLYEGNKIGMHTPHSNVNEPICKASGVAIMPLEVPR